MELFKQKYCLERERNKEIVMTLKGSFWAILIAFSLPNAFSLILLITRKPDNLDQMINFRLILYAIGLCFLIILTAFLFHWKVSIYQKKIDKVERQIIEELAKS